MSGSEPAERVLDRTREDERRLVEAAQQDRARFADIYEEYFELVYAYIARRTRHREEAEDLTAEVFRKALEHLPRFKWTGAPFAAWLFRIGSNLIADRAKRSGRELNLESPPEATIGAATDFEAAEKMARIFRMVGNLAEDQRSVIVMRFAEDKSIREIAEALGRSEGAVKQLQFRALENLRARLAK
ncbi:MAG TPA: sigma-70 family RNA polymerase sigma factor [Pyrinomonadaceae bacterium]|nr:sigma-70 family RNA polymerase sigma factor [Pyrinomonadaceae bacterium]